ncbi:hypothetical protein ACEQ8V_002197 [Pseudomonas aeruginosa]
MFNPANQTHFSLSLDGLRHDLQVLAFNGHEGISRPYRFELELVSERAGLDLEALMHGPPSSPSPRRARVSTAWSTALPKAMPASA